MDIKAACMSGLMLIASASAHAERQYGIVKLDGEGHAVLITAQAVSGARQVVHLQYPDALQRAACCKQLPSSEFRLTETSDEVATNELEDKPTFRYVARIPQQWARMPFAGSAVVGRRLTTKNVKGQLVSRDAQGRIRSADTCTSQEGVHLIQQQGTKESTHIYLPLGYDVESPSCR
jgi:hypothetical protein